MICYSSRRGLSRGSRQIPLGPVADSVAGYGAASQAKWAAWRRKEGIEYVREPNPDNQMLLVIAVLGHISFSGPAWRAGRSLSKTSAPMTNPHLGLPTSRLRRARRARTLPLLALLRHRFLLLVLHLDVAARSAGSRSNHGARDK